MTENVLSFNQWDEQGYYVINASIILEGINFKRMPLVLSRRGFQKLYYDANDFIEVTDLYKHYYKISNTENQKPKE